MSKSITQDTAYTLMKYAEKYGERRARLIRDMRRRNPGLGLIGLWHRLKKRGYTRRPEDLFRLMRKPGMFSSEKGRY